MLSPYLVIGEILKPQGIKGELKVRPITCDPERFEGLSSLFFMKDEQPVLRKIRVTRIDRDAVYMMFDGVKDRNAAELLRGELLYVDRANAIKLPKNAEFICDLIGCVAQDDDGRELGTLVDVLQPGGNDVYVLKGPLGEVLVPALKTVVLSVDVKEKRMLLSAKRLAEVAVFNED
ncbi:ribosome maturation factor RimM [Eubacteriales bacterium OttesenSCG-928-N13]|nr:ribosome maturation factor RimM [Eubacteriales bacterium OttesenSCG-928-N13]